MKLDRGRAYSKLGARLIMADSSILHLYFGDTPGRLIHFLIRRPWWMDRITRLLMVMKPTRLGINSGNSLKTTYTLLFKLSLTFQFYETHKY